MPNTSRGAGYFRGRHNYKKCSGGLLVDKSTHHFDLVNWLVAAAANRSLASGLPVRIVELAALEPEATRLSQLA